MNTTPTSPDSPRNVKPALTPKRRTDVENDEYAAFLRRILRAYSRRIAAGDIDALTDITNLAHDLETATHHAITGLRAHGYSWTDIGNATGITRQAAQQRWGNRPTGIPAEDPPAFCDHQHGHREHQCAQCHNLIIDGGCTAYCGTCPCCEPSDLCLNCRRSS